MLGLLPTSEAPMVEGGTVTGNGGRNAPIPGAPSWVGEFMRRVDDKLEVFADRVETAAANLELVAHEYKPFRDRVAELEAGQARMEADIIELKAHVRRSLTPPGGFAAVPSGPPDDAA